MVNSPSIDLYLILHKVRGEPAFDIARRVTDDPLAELEGPYWIIPTSGHRAYPYWFTRLHQTCCEIWLAGTNRDCMIEYPSMDEGIPDHYPAKSSPVQQKTSVLDLFPTLKKQVDRRM